MADTAYLSLHSSSCLLLQNDMLILTEFEFHFKVPEKFKKLLSLCCGSARWLRLRSAEGAALQALWLQHGNSDSV